MSEVQDEPKQRMPAYCRANMMQISGKNYLQVPWRVVWFRDEHPRGQITSTLLEGGFDHKWATFRADVYDEDGKLLGSGTSSCTMAGFPKGFMEACETSAIGRALGFAGFGTQFSPEIDDDGSKLADAPVQSQRQGGTANQVQQHMQATGQQHAVANPGPAAPQAASTTNGPVTPAIWEGPGQCNSCHAPAGKRHGVPCIARSA